MWKEIAASKRAARDKAIPKDWLLPAGHVSDNQINVIHVPENCDILTSRELEITALEAQTLVQKILDRDYSSYEVTLAFCKRAAIAQQLVNCLSEIFFDAALSAAKRVDAEYASTSIPSGPLHGLPVSLKDCFRVAGVDTTIGYTAFANSPTPEDQESEITKTMRESGAILFCKTNVPPGLMLGETYNAIYGYTSNPYNRNLISGGSSGGESALLALRGSPLGIGTDVGGSIRIPASFCGLYALKPSSGRFPTSGLRDGMEGQEAVRNTIGPMATSLSALELWCRAVLRTEPWMRDTDCIPLPFREVEVPKKLCFGLLLDDGHVKPLPPVTNALLQTKAALEAAGHTVIDFHINDPHHTTPLKHTLYRSAAATTVHTALTQTSEPWPKGMELLTETLTQNPATVTELWAAQAKRTAYANQLLKSWVATKSVSGTGREMDALIMPVSPWDGCERFGFCYDNYTSLWNVVDYCAVGVPVRGLEGGEDELERVHEARNEIEAGIWERYEAEKVKGAPVGIQIVGRRLNEEYLLQMARVCDEALKKAEGKMSRMVD
ncbi:amidase signature domain-containing protein [Aspergillus karnatakaensis]|uniref:amidase signature domain-containing protein n=1 Tax=Aspergillus karnatakaensis TaxID=1810916 RepID=UPI003CCE2788